MAKPKQRRRANKNKGKKRKAKKGIQHTAAWDIASWDYSVLIAQDMFPLLHAPLMGQKRIENLKGIINGCPEFYPALIELGYRYIKEDQDETAKEYLDKGLKSVYIHFSKKEQKEVYYQTCEFLEKHLRYELAVEYYNQLMEIERDKATVYDLISCCYVYLGEFDKAYDAQQNALAINDSNNKFYSNMGWLEMLRGNLEQAKVMLERSLELKKRDKYAMNNYEVCNVLIKDKKLNTWEDYLLRPIDYEYLDDLREKDKFDEYSKQVQIYNQERLEAFKFDLIRNTKYSLSEKFDIMFTLNYIFDLIQRLDLYDEFFYEDAAEVEINFKLIMHKFILKTGDIDEEIFNGAYTALQEFYNFLAKRKVITGNAHKNLRQEMLALKPELIRKMNRYNKVRHNDEYTEKEKEELRED